MVKFFIFIFITMSTLLYSSDLPVMLKVKANFDLDASVIDTFRSGAEDTLTANGYTLISKQQQNEALKEQAAQQNSDCYDDSCLVDTGKMMAAQMVFIIDVSKMKNEYIFKARLVDLESGSTKRTITKVYIGELDSASVLLKFSKNLTSESLKVSKNKVNNQNVSDLIKVVISTKPSGANIYIEDKLIGKSPAQAKITKGVHNFKITMNNYQDYTFKREFYMDSNETIELGLCYKENPELCYKASKKYSSDDSAKKLELLKRSCSFNYQKACFLLDRIKNKNYIKNNGVSFELLIDRIKANDLFSVKLILSKREDIKHFDRQNNKKCTVHYAAENNNIEILKLLLNYNVPKSCFKEDHNFKKTPHYLAAKNKNIEMHKLLMMHHKPIKDFHHIGFYITTYFSSWVYSLFVSDDTQVFERINDNSMIDYFKESDDMENKIYSKKLESFARIHSNDWFPVKLVFSPIESQLAIGVGVVNFRWENFYFKWLEFYVGADFSGGNFIALGYSLNSNFHSLNFEIGAGIEVHDNYLGSMPVQLSYRYTFDDTYFIQVGVMAFLVRFNDSFYGDENKEPSFLDSTNIVFNFGVF